MAIDPDNLPQDATALRQMVVGLLEQLETVLVELSNGPQTVPSADLGELRVRLDEGDVLFKVRVLGSRLRREVDTGSRDHEDSPAAREI